MAAKALADTKSINPSSRIAKKEAIVTRLKSAQLKRQLRGGDRSMKKITRLLKSPERPRHLTVNKSSSAPLKTYKNTTVKQQTSPKSQKLLAAQVMSLLKSPRKKKVTEKVEEKEFHPNKVKRKVVNRKVTLKPKHELTKLLSLNKRKWTTPRKGISSPITTSTIPPIVPLHLTPPPEPAPVESPILSFSELVKTCDDINGMTDEDLIEILTCPSPVWWEGPPDWRYDEDPIPKNLLGKLPSNLRKSSSKLLQSPSIIENAISTEQRIPVEKESSGLANTSTDSQKNMSVDEKISPIDVSIELTTKDDKFIRKRSTLENILSCMKTKRSSDKFPPQIANSANAKIPGSQVSKTTNSNFDAIDKVLKENSGLLQISLKKHKPSILKTEPLFASRKDDIIDVTSDSTTQESNEDIFAGIREDEILNDLENFEIPIETNNDARKRKSTLIEADECIFLYDGENASSSLVDKSQVVPEGSLETIVIEGSDELTSERNKVFVPPTSTETTVWSKREESLKNKKKESANEAKTVPEDMPPLWRYLKVTETKMASPGNSKLESGESDFENSSVISGQDVDTISDTNVKYLNDDQISDYEGERLKSKAEADSVKNIEDKLEESTEVDSKEKEDICLNEVKSENNDIDQTEDRNESSVQKPDVASQAEELECKKDCIIVYKIIETKSESNENQNDELGLINKPKSIIKVKMPRSSSRVQKTSPKARASNTHQQTTFNTINDFFKKCKTGYLKPAEVKKINYRVQKLNKTVNRRGKVIRITKKTFEGDSTNNQVTDDKKSIAVTDSKTVNYCLKCSSIFDTNVCNYCVKNT